MGALALAGGLACLIGNGTRLSRSQRALLERQSITLTSCGAWTTTHRSSGRHGSTTTTTPHVLAACRVGERTAFAHFTSEPPIALGSEASSRFAAGFRALRNGRPTAGSVAPERPDTALPCQASVQNHPLCSGLLDAPTWVLCLVGSALLLFSTNLLAATLRLPGRPRLYRYQRGNCLTLPASQSAATFCWLGLPVLFGVTFYHFVALWRIGLGVPRGVAGRG